MRLFNLFPAHLLLDFLQRNRRIRVTANGRQRVPHIGPHQIRRGHPQPDLIIPANPRLRPSMTFHRGPQIPLKGPDIIPLDPQPQRIHHADQLLRIRIPGAGGGPKRLHRRLKAPGLHQVLARLNRIGQRRPGQKPYYRYTPHALLLASSAAAMDLPAPLTDQDFRSVDPAQARIGQLLFYDKILSGNRNISCGTCHHHDHGGTDGLALGIGEGGVGVGPNRTPGTGPSRVKKRIPRNAPALWNLGHKDVRNLFHDGRLSVSDIYQNGFDSPAEEWLPQGLDSITAAQALFPLTAQFEMAGNPKENEIAGAIHDRIDTAWPILAKRVRVIPEYGAMFVAAFPEIGTPEEVTIVEIANAIAAFIETEWRNHDSPFDDHLAGTPLPPAAARGMALFFGEVGCAGCHSGPLFTDQGFHALGLPAFGPGRTRRWDHIARDAGRMGKSDRLEDAYHFRTPSLRNVALTAPYGHNGAHATLPAMIRQHMNPAAARKAWKPSDTSLPQIPWLASADLLIQHDSREMARQTAASAPVIRSLSNAEIADITAFLHSLTGKTARTRPMGRPDQVPSGLPVD